MPSAFVAAVFTAMAATACFAPSAGAAPYNYFYTTSPKTYVANVGTDVLVKIYLREDAPVANSSTSLINTDGGLANAAVRVTRTSGTSSAFVAGSVAGNVGSAPNGFADVTIASTSGNVASLVESTSINETVGVASGTLAGTGFNGIFLGSLKVRVGAGAATTFTLTPYLGSVTNDSSYDLDNSAGNEALYNSAASDTFTVSAPVVPEPTAIAAGVAAAIALAARRRRRV